jgi:hypothetical protein
VFLSLSALAVPLLECACRVGGCGTERSGSLLSSPGTARSASTRVLMEAQARPPLGPDDR